MNVKIQELPESLTLNDDDVFPIDRSSDDVTAKVSIDTFKQYIINYLTQYFADDATISLDEATNTFSVKNVFLPLSGGTMTDFITLHSSPTEPLHPVTKNYVDVIVGSLDADGKVTYVKRSGDVMTGPLRIQSTLNTTGRINAGGGVDIVGTTTAQGAVAVTGSTTITQDLAAGGTLNVGGASTFGGDVEFSNKKINHFTANIKNISLGTVPNNEYTLSLDDNGAILNVTGAGPTCIVRCPGGLPVGFNVMLVQNSASNVYVLPLDISISVNHLDGHTSIRKQYGVCNIVCLQANSFVIAGDLS